MSDTTIVAPVIETQSGSPAAFSWNVAIAGALAAIAVSIIFYALGTGIGMTLVSPYGDQSASAGTLTAVGAVWLIMAQTFAFAIGGYLAARLRARAHIPGQETRFRDAAHGFMCWAIGVIIAGMLAGVLGMFSAGAGTAVTSAAVGNATSKTDASGGNDVVGYYVDTLFRTDPAHQTQTATATAAPGAPTTSGQATRDANGNRDEVNRILLVSVRDGKLADADRAYLTKLVAARTGLSEPEAEKRVTETEARARDTITKAAETARKATAYMSFWTFMALLFGAVAGTLGGMVGGALRDDEWTAYEREVVR
jgi:hypothetical protein